MGGTPIKSSIYNHVELFIWVWINTYENTIFRGLFTSINPSYFDVNYRGTKVLTHCHID